MHYVQKKKNIIREWIGEYFTFRYGFRLKTKQFTLRNKELGPIHDFDTTHDAEYSLLSIHGQIAGFAYAEMPAREEHHALSVLHAYETQVLLIDGLGSRCGRGGATAG